MPTALLIYSTYVKIVCYIYGCYNSRTISARNTTARISTTSNTTNWGIDHGRPFGQIQHATCQLRPPAVRSSRFSFKHELHAWLAYKQSPDHDMLQVGPCGWSAPDELAVFFSRFLLLSLAYKERQRGVRSQRRRERGGSSHQLATQTEARTPLQH
jgi:hypothetical protein